MSIFLIVYLTTDYLIILAKVIFYFLLHKLLPIFLFSILLFCCLVVLLSGCFVVCLEDSTERSESNLGRSLGLLSLRSVLASSQSYQQADNKTSRQQNNQTTRQFIDIFVSVVQSSRQGLVWVAQFLLSHCNALFLWIDAKLASAI